MTAIPPGWYKDPAEPTTQRYWDGEGWIGDPLPADAAPPPGPPVVAASSAPVTPPAPPVAAPPAPAPISPAGAGWPAPPLGARPGSPLPPGLGLPPGASLPPGGALPRDYAGYPYLLIRPRPHGLPVAPLGLRLLARIIDMLVVLVLNTVGNGWFVYLWIKDMGPYLSTVWHAGLNNQTNVDLPAIPGRANALVYVIPLVAMALWWAYEVPGIASAGQTFGKRLVGIKVMALEKEEPIGLGRAFRRWNPLGLPVLLWVCGLGFLLQLVDCISPALGGPLQLALHDRSAQTVVVHCGRRGHEKTPEKVPAKTGEET